MPALSTEKLDCQPTIALPEKNPEGNTTASREEDELTEDDKLWRKIIPCYWGESD